MSRRERVRQSGLHINTICKLANNQNTLLHLVVYLSPADKYPRLTRRLS